MATPLEFFAPGEVCSLRLEGELHLSLDHAAGYR